MEQFTNTFQFVVNKRQVGKDKTLKASILYNKVADFANALMFQRTGLLALHPTSFNWNLLSNAFLKEELTVNCTVNQFTENAFELLVTVQKKNKEIICNASFGYALKKAS